MGSRSCEKWWALLYTTVRLAQFAFPPGSPLLFLLWARCAVVGLVARGVVVLVGSGVHNLIERLALPPPAAPVSDGWREAAGGGAGGEEGTSSDPPSALKEQHPLGDKEVDSHVFAAPGRARPILPMRLQPTLAAAATATTSHSLTNTTLRSTRWRSFILTPRHVASSPLAT